jgi:hypothetical protein
MPALTPLFPPNDKPISIKQGKIGDCYLLAALDCILNSGQEGRDAVTSRFTLTQEGGVIVRLKRPPNPYTYPKKSKLMGKYTHYYNKSHNEDVFFLDQKRLEEIDSTHDGVFTNALAVKILERLCTYYFDLHDWGSQESFASLYAHDLEKRFSGTSSAFVANLLNIAFHDITTINEIIKLKEIYPEHAIYISIDYGKPDQAGKIHGRHALKIGKIVPFNNGLNDYQFILVNPWNNQDQENIQDTYSLADIKLRQPKFCIFSPDPKQLKKIRIQLLLSEAESKFITDNPPLLDQLLQINTVNQANIEASIKQYRLMQIDLIIGQSPQKRNFVTQDPALLQQLLALPKLNKQTIEKHIEHYQQKIQFTKALAIAQSTIFPYFTLIGHKLANMQQKTIEKNAKPTKSEQVATQLYTSLIQAKLAFLDLKKPLLGKVDKLVNSTLIAINAALPSLAKEIAWREILVNLAKLILALMHGNFSLARNRFQLFTTKTDFAQTLLHLKETVLVTNFAVTI